MNIFPKGPDDEDQGKIMVSMACRRPPVDGGTSQLSRHADG